MQSSNLQQFKSEAFKVLIYDASIASVNSTKDKVLTSGFYDVLSETDLKECIGTILEQNPQVLITDHRANDGLNAFDNISRLRQLSDIPVIIWGNRLPEKTEHSLLALKKVYTLCSKDGIFTLRDLLQRLKMMRNDPALWA
jgi:DNA-binding response OmpR family regulator